MRILKAAMAAMLTGVMALATPATAEPAKVMFDSFWPLGGQVSSDVSIVSFSSPQGSRTAVFARGMDGALWWQAGDLAGNWFGWASLGGEIQGSPSCVTEKDYVQCFVRWTDNALWVNTYNIKKNSWTGFVSRGGKISSSPTAARYTHDDLGSATFVFARAGNRLFGLQTALYSSNQDLFAPSPTWYPLTSGGVSGEPACFSEGISKGVTCLFESNGNGWKTLAGAHQLPTGAGDQYPKGATPIDTKHRIGTVNLAGTLYAFHQDVAGGVLVARRDKNGLWDAQTPAVGAPNTGIGCNWVKMVPPKGTIWCAFANKSGAVAVMRYNSGSKF